MHVKKFRITEGKIFKPIKGKMQQKQIWKIKLNLRKGKKEKKANKHKKCKIERYSNNSKQIKYSKDVDFFTCTK